MKEMKEILNMTGNPMKGILNMKVILNSHSSFLVTLLSFHLSAQDDNMLPLSFPSFQTSNLSLDTEHTTDTPTSKLQDPISKSAVAYRFHYSPNFNTALCDKPGDATGYGTYSYSSIGNAHIY